ncbi:MAG TPA: MFS transporter [Candidatus Limnocylindrales bacterium]|nr:MFS transporter [Candidatus Limnocylindrales bacterium]
MSKMLRLGNASADSRASTVYIVLIGTTFIWYFLEFNFIKNAMAQLNFPYSVTLAIIGTHVGAMATAALLITIVTDKARNRFSFVCGWLLFGAFLSLLPIFLPLETQLGLELASGVFGAYMGLGMPATMGLFAAKTKYENRAKLAGIAFLLIGLGWFSLGTIVGDNTQTFSLVLAAIRLVGFFPFLLLGGRNEENELVEKPPTYRSIIEKRPFLLYFLPWITFSLVNFLTMPFSNAPFGLNQNLVNFSITIENVFIAISALATGFLAGMFGRRRLAIFGFVMLGLGYGTLGFSSIALGLTAAIGLLFYTVMDGIAWGVFYVIFLFTLWGDIAQNHRSDKFYVIGAMPYLCSDFMQLWLHPYVALIPSAAIFSLASVLLFLGVAPLFYAPETLPEEMIKSREMQMYIAEAEKVKHKQR